jgi:hypothetical protein
LSALVATLDADLFAVSIYLPGFLCALPALAGFLGGWIARRHPTKLAKQLAVVDSRNGGVMAVNLYINPATGFATFTCTGTVTVEELKTTAQRLGASPEFGGTQILWDLAGASFNLSAAEVQELAEFTKGGGHFQSAGKAAYLASADLEFGLLRMFKVYREQGGVQVAVFRDREEAIAWLEDPGPNDPPLLDGRTDG